MSLFYSLALSTRYYISLEDIFRFGETISIIFVFV